MTTKNFLIAFACTIVFIACKESMPNDDNVKTIAAGHMPSLAKDTNDHFLHMVYGSGDSLMYVYSNDGGESFSKPVLVDTFANLVASATRGPQITATKNGAAIIAVNTNGNIFSFIQNTTGEWIRTAKVNDEDEIDKEGFSGLSSDGNNNLFAIWTDLRGDKHNKIYGAKSTAGGQTWERNILVYVSPDSNICECCKPSVAMQGSNVYVMFRNWLDGNRDLFLIQSSNGGESFGNAKKLGNGSWKLNACPMDGGGLAIAANGVPQTVWRRQTKIYTARPDEPEQEIGEGKGCSIETIKDKNAYVWSDENKNIVCFLPDNSQKILGKGILPLLKYMGDDKVVCVWQEDDLIKRAVVNL